MRKGNDIYNQEKEQAGDTTQDAKVLNSLGGIFLLFGSLSFVFLKLLPALSIGKSQNKRVSSSMTINPELKPLQKICFQLSYHSSVTHIPLVYQEKSR
jgi:hypothetical protein